VIDDLEVPSLLPALWPLVVAIPFALVMRLAADRLERAARQRRLGTLEERLQRAGAQMVEARQLVDGVEAELTARQAALARLVEEAAEWERLASLKEREAQAVAALVRGEVQRGGRRSLWQGTVVNALFFAAGYAVQLLQ